MTTDKNVTSTEDDDVFPTVKLTPAESNPPNSQSATTDVDIARSLSRRSNGNKKISGPAANEDRPFSGDLKKLPSGRNTLQPNHARSSLTPTYNPTLNPANLAKHAKGMLLRKLGHSARKPPANSCSSSESGEGPPPGYTPGDAVKSKRPKKKNKGELTARERNRLMYDIDMNEAIMAFDMNDIEPLKRNKVSIAAVKQPSVISNDYTAIRAAEIEAQQEKEMEQRRVLGVRMQRHRDKLQLERYGTYEKSKGIPFKQLKENKAFREAEAMKKKAQAAEGKKAKQTEVGEDNTESEFPNKGQMYVKLLRKQLIRLDNFRNVDNVYKQPMPYELPKADESNSKYLVKNEHGKMVPMPPEIPGLPKYALPNLRYIVLRNCLPHTKPHGPLTTTYIGEPSVKRTEYKMTAFNLHDLENKHHMLIKEYDACTDPHLKKYLRNYEVRSRLQQMGLVNDEGRVVVDRRDYNRYRRNLHYNAKMQHHFDQSGTATAQSFDHRRRSETQRRAEDVATCLKNDRALDHFRFVTPLSLHVANMGKNRRSHVKDVKARLAELAVKRQQKIEDKIKADDQRSNRVELRMLNTEINREKVNNEREMKRRDIREKNRIDAIVRRRKMIKKWNDNKVAIERKIKEDKANALLLKYKEEQQRMACHHVFQLEKMKLEGEMKKDLEEERVANINKHHVKANALWKKSAEKFELNSQIRRLEKRQCDNNYVNNFNIRLHIIRQENDEKEKLLSYEKRRQMRMASGVVKLEDIRTSGSCEVVDLARPSYLQTLRQTNEDDRRKPNLTSPVFKRRLVRPMNANIFGTSYEPYWPIAADELVNGRVQQVASKPRKVKLGGADHFPHLNSALPVSTGEKSVRKERRRLFSARNRQSSVVKKPTRTTSTPGVRKMLERTSSIDSLQSF